MPKRPLSIDLTHQVITVLNQVIGYTLTLVSEDGIEYAYTLFSNTITLPDNLEGEFELQITNGSVTYIGKLYI